MKMECKWIAAESLIMFGVIEAHRQAGILPEADQWLGFTKWAQCLTGCIPVKSNGLFYYRRRWWSFIGYFVCPLGFLIKKNVCHSHKCATSPFRFCCNFFTLTDKVICYLAFVRQPVQQIEDSDRFSENEWNTRDSAWHGHAETSAWRQWKGEQNKTSELMGRSGVEQRKIDDLMEVWRQWAGRRGIWEAGGEGQDEIRYDDQWTPTQDVSAWQVIKASQRKRENWFTNCLYAPSSKCRFPLETV